MADVLIDGATMGLLHNAWGAYGPFWTAPDTGYIVVLSVATELEIHKTTDSGATWAETDGASAPGQGDFEIRSIGAYFDQETRGNSGTLIHVAYVHSGDNAVYYTSFDTADDTWDGTPVSIDLLTVSAISSDSHVSVTVAASGRIYVATTGDLDVHVEDTDHSMRSSNDFFAADNQSESSPFSSDEEQIILLPDGVAADSDDICAVVFDFINEDMEFWKYDRTGTAWSKTTVDTDIAGNSFFWRQFRLFDATTRHSDDAIICAYHTNGDQDSALQDLRTAEITPATPTVTPKADVITATDDWSSPCIFINQQNNDVYVGYAGSDDGTEDIFIAVRMYFKISDDDMGSWGTEQAYGILNDDLRITHAGHMVLDAGGRYMPIFWNEDLDDLLVNDGNDIEIAAAAPVGIIPAASVENTNIIKTPDRMIPY